MSTQDVLNHHLQAFASGDVEEALKDYTDDSVLISADGRLQGRASIRAALQELFSGLFRPGTYEVTVDAIEVEGDVAFTAWHSTNEGASIPLGTDTFLIRDGKIAVQTFALRVDPN